MGKRLIESIFTALFVLLILLVLLVLFSVVYAESQVGEARGRRPSVSEFAASYIWIAMRATAVGIVVLIGTVVSWVVRFKLSARGADAENNRNPWIKRSIVFLFLPVLFSLLFVFGVVVYVANTARSQTTLSPLPTPTPAPTIDLTSYAMEDKILFLRGTDESTGEEIVMTWERSPIQ